MNSSPLSFLIVDDDDLLATALAKSLVKRGFEVRTATNVEQAIGLVRERRPARMIVDLKMPGESGMTLLQRMQQLSPETKSVVLTGYGSIANAVEAMKLGAVNYVTKPADADEILLAFDKNQSTDVDGELHRPSLAESEWNHIQKVLADCDGNITQAARVLDIPRRTLQRKLKKRMP